MWGHAVARQWSKAIGDPVMQVARVLSVCVHLPAYIHTDPGNHDPKRIAGQETLDCLLVSQTSGPPNN